MKNSRSARRRRHLGVGEAGGIERAFLQRRRIDAHAQRLAQHQHVTGTAIGIAVHALGVDQAQRHQAIDGLQQVDGMTTRDRDARRAADLGAARQHLADHLGRQLGNGHADQGQRHDRAPAHGVHVADRVGGGDAAKVKVAAVSNVTASDPRVFVGTSSCTAVSCHGANPKHGVFRAEYSAWLQKDRHAQAYNILFNETSVRMAELLKLEKPAHEAQLCLNCHAPVTSDAPFPAAFNVEQHQDIVSEGVKHVDSLVAANWDSLVFDLGEDPLQRVPMMDPLKGTEELTKEVLDSSPAARDLLAALGMV